MFGLLVDSTGRVLIMIATGAGLMAIDERSHLLGDDDTNVGLRTYRPTLEVGAIVTAAGAAALGFSVYSATGRDAATWLPAVSPSGGGATFGVAGRF